MILPRSWYWSATRLHTEWGAVLSHRDTDGKERPIAYASRSLATAERNYSQLEKEGLAIVFGVKKFHPYLFGRPFSITSDHKPLHNIYKETSAIPLLASARIQCWALLLGGYDYKISYKPGHQHANADMLSCLPSNTTPPEPPALLENVYVLETLDSSPGPHPHHCWPTPTRRHSPPKCWDELSVLRQSCGGPTEGPVIEALHKGHQGGIR